MKKFLANLKHLPTTIAGSAAVVAAVAQDPTVQQLAGMNPKVANYVTGAGSLAAGLVLIFGTGAKK